MTTEDAPQGMLQDIFDRVVTHLRTQGKPAYECGRCRYHTSDGLKCAVGALIPDDLYDPVMEGCGVTNPEVREIVAKALPGLDNLGFALLRHLQYAHDAWADEIAGGLKRALEPRLRAIAAEFNLTYTEPA